MPPSVSTYGSSKVVDGPTTAPYVIPPSNAAQFFLLNGVQEGTSKFNRIGDRIRMKSIQIFGKWVPRNDEAHEARVFGRLAIIYDRYPKGDVPNVNDIFQMFDETSQAVNNTYAWSPPNPTYSDRFIIVRDCKWNFTTNTPTSTNVMATLMMNNNTVEGNDCSLYKKLSGLETQYLSTRNPIQISNIGTGALWFLIWGNNPDVANAPGSFEWSWRLRFYDY